MPSRPSLIRTWLQLFRAPNLFTVPGDPLAGYLLASFGAVEPRLALAIGASLCFYAAGLLLNDLADLREDREERPDRPLPSGAAKPAAVVAVMIALTVAALALCAKAGPATLAAGIALGLVIATYNLGAKHFPFIGALNMGTCRALSMLLGATAVPHGELTIPLMMRGRLDHLAVAMVIVVLFIAAVTDLARFETKPKVPHLAKWLPLLPLIAGALWFLSHISPIAYAQELPFLGELLDDREVMVSARRICAVLLIVANIRVALVAWQLERNPADPVPPQIGELIRTLLVIQAGLCAASGGIPGSFASMALLALWPLSRLASHRFYAS